jgi:hypothetical protein
MIPSEPMSVHDDAMNGPPFDSFVARRLAAIDLCFREGLFTESLVLLYSGVDALAWLTLPSGSDGSSRDFIAWVNTYLLPDSGLQCSAEDIWAARCGLLHSNIAESRKSREGTAREICYLLDGDGSALVHVLADTPVPAVNVRIDQLIAAFRKAIDSFKSMIESQPELAVQVYERARHHFYSGHFLKWNPDIFRYSEV